MDSSNPDNLENREEEEAPKDSWNCKLIMTSPGHLLVKKVATTMVATWIATLRAVGDATKETSTRAQPTKNSSRKRSRGSWSNSVCTSSR